MENEIYKFEWNFNREVCSELKWYVAFSKGGKTYYIAFTIALAVLTIFSFGVRQYVAGFITLFGVILFPVLFVFRINEWSKRQFKQYFELTGKKEIIATLTFTDEVIKVENHTTGSRTQLKYKDVVRLIETKNHYVFQTKATVFIDIKKSSFDNNLQKREFLAFIQDKCVNLKGRKYWRYK